MRINLHWTVRKAIRARVLEIIEPYIMEALEILEGQGIHPVFDKEVTASLMVYGTGGTILQEDTTRYQERQDADQTELITCCLGVRRN
jgi:hypothetical protein